MIGRLCGVVVSDEGDSVVLDVAGVGYEVWVPLGTLGRASRDGESVILHVHTHAREDALQLFGFATPSDKVAFRILIGVSQVGPKIALAVLSTLPAGDLAAAIAKKEVGKLTSISGIGKKTAERLLLELRDKLPEGPGTTTSEVLRKPSQGAPHVLVSTLVHMGYRAQEAERVLTQLGDRVDAIPLAEAIREALALLAK